MRQKPLCLINLKFIGIISLLIISAGMQGFCSENGTYIARDDSGIRIGNSLLELQFKFIEGNPQLFILTNKLSNRSIPIKSSDISIGIEGKEPLRMSDFTFNKAEEKELPSGKQINLLYANSANGIELREIYELGNSDFFIRRWFEIFSKSPLPFRRVDVWLIGISGKRFHDGFGQPVLLEDTFWGLEYPAGHNYYNGEIIRLTQFPGRDADRFTSRKAVLGVSEMDNVEKRFKQYVETIRVTSNEITLFVNYNTWWTLMPPTEQNSLALVEKFGSKLYQQHGETIDTFTMDDGWDDDNTLWEFDKGFPDGFANLKEALNKANIRLGLWISPSSGYNHGPPLAKQGYDLNSDGWHLCQSGEKYRTDMPKRVVELVEKYDIDFVKFDGFNARCDAQDHSHLPGDYSIEANVDAYIELIEAVRQVKPDVYLDLTVGIWLSPWWLEYGDSLWAYLAGDYPDPIIPSVVKKDSMTTNRDSVYRERIRQHPGFPIDAIEHLGIIVITPEKWEDDAVAVLGRGCRLLTLYIDPSHFVNGERDWTFLASVLRWARHNASTLLHTELILGEPNKRQTYGYSHFPPRSTSSGDGKGIIMLRNPFVEPETVEIKLDSSVGWDINDKDKRFIIRSIYPYEKTALNTVKYGDTLTMELQAFETVMLQIEPLTETRPAIAGIRHRKISHEGNTLEYEVYGIPGEETIPLLVGDNPLSKVFLNGTEIKTKSTDDGITMPLKFPGEKTGYTLNGSGFESVTIDEMWDISADWDVYIPENSRAEMHILVEPRGRFTEGMKCITVIDGKEVEVRLTESMQRGRWFWFAFDIPSGENKVSVKVSSASGSGVFNGEIGSWLWLEQKLGKSDLKLIFEKSIPTTPEEPLLLPIHMDTLREVITIQEQTNFSAGRPWPEPVKLDEIEADVVYLDLLIPDSVTQGYGTLQRRQSVWEKEMIIAGEKYYRGLGTHANGNIVFNLPEGRFSKFRSIVGRDGNVGDGKISFEVWVDGEKVFDSGIMTASSKGKEIEVDVAGAGKIELRTLDDGDSITSDHGNWANARFER